MGISADTEEENAAFADKFDFNFPLLCDTDRRVSETYGALETHEAEYPSRITYVIDPEGRIARVYRTVSAAVHPDEVLAFLRGNRS